MLAAVYHGVNDLRVEDIVKPTIGEDEALLRVKAAAICGTDLRILASGHFKIPQAMTRILGHEFAGEVVEVGDTEEFFTGRVQDRRTREYVEGKFG